MKLKELSSLPRDEVYDMVTKDRITPKTEHEGSASRSFPKGARAYRWTNEPLSSLNDAGLDLGERSVLLVSASGDPYGTFACLNAGFQLGFDTSHRAALWCEFKTEAVEQLNFDEFRVLMALAGEPDPARIKDIYERVSHGLSKYARSIFDDLFEKFPTISEIVQSQVFFREGNCSGVFPKCNLFTTTEENYEKAREVLTERPPITIPGTLDDALKITDDSFGVFYGSNIFDHFRSPNNPENFDYSEANLRPFIELVESHLIDDSIWILQCEWSAEAKQVASKVLQEMGYTMRDIPKTVRAYGQLYIAERKPSTKKIISTPGTEVTPKQADSIPVTHAHMHGKGIPAGETIIQTPLYTPSILKTLADFVAGEELIDPYHPLGKDTKGSGKYKDYYYDKGLK